MARGDVCRVQRLVDLQRPSAFQPGASLWPLAALVAPVVRATAALAIGFLVRVGIYRAGALVGSTKGLALRATLRVLQLLDSQVFMTT